MSRRSFLKIAVAASAAISSLSGAVLGLGRAAPGALDTLTPITPAVWWKDVALNVNGRETTVRVKANWTLLDVLRENLFLTGTKSGCLNSECGACTVLLDGSPIYSCHRLAVEVDGHAVTTIEGIGQGGLTKLQQAFIDHGAFQCGYCTPGFVVAATALLRSNPNPNEAQVVQGLSGNICRCGAYPQIVKAVLSAAQGAP